MATFLVQKTENPNTSGSIAGLSTTRYDNIRVAYGVIAHADISAIANNDTIKLDLGCREVIRVSAVYFANNGSNPDLATEVIQYPKTTAEITADSNQFIVPIDFTGVTADFTIRYVVEYVPFGGSGTAASPARTTVVFDITK